MEIDESSPHKRSLSDVKSVIKLAKLNEKKLTDLSQAIYFDEHEVHSNNFKLLELNSHLSSSIAEGQTLRFKGGLNEKVVLCTDTKTFEVKEAGISNSILLIPELRFGQATSAVPLQSPGAVQSTSLDRSLNSSSESVEDECSESSRQIEVRVVKNVFHEYFECREVKPKFRKLYDLLQLSRFSGPENEYCVERSVLFTYEQMLDTLQCSRAEFDAGLRSFHAFEIDGRIRMLDVDYEYRLLSIMLGIVTENSWSVDSVHREETLASISETTAPANIVEKLFDLYTIQSERDGKVTHAYNEEAVCRTIALNLLQQGMKFHYDDFMSSWQDVLPEGMTVDEKYLNGIGIVDTDSGKAPCVRALIETHLPTNLIDRLRILFKSRERWTLDQIQPYIEYFATPQLTVTSILAKHARSITEDGKRVYVSRHGV